MWLGRGVDFTGDGNADVYVGGRVGREGWILALWICLTAGALALIFFAYLKWTIEDSKYLTKARVEYAIETTRFSADCGHSLVEFKGRYEGTSMQLTDIDAARTLAGFPGHINLDISSFWMSEEAAKELASKRNGVVCLYGGDCWRQDWIIRLLQSSVPLQLHFLNAELDEELAKAISHHKGPIKLFGLWIRPEHMPDVVKWLKQHRGSIMVEDRQEEYYAHGKLPACM